MKKNIPFAIGIAVIIVVALLAFVTISHQQGVSMQSGTNSQSSVATNNPPPNPPCCKTTSTQSMTQSTAVTNSSSIAVPPPPPPPSQPSGLAIYTNSQYGFSFSYPTAWSLTIDSSTPNEVTFNTTATQLYGITWYQKNPQQSLLAWYKAQLASGGDGTVYSSTSSIINGYNGLDVYYVYPPGIQSESNGEYDFLLSNNKTVLDFFWSPFYFQDQGAEAVVNSVRFQ